MKWQIMNIWQIMYVNCRNEIKIMKKMILAVVYAIKEIAIRPEKIV